MEANDKISVCKKYNIAVVLLLVIYFPHIIHAQQYDTVSVFNMPISLDTIVIKSGFDVGAFIKRVRNDTTFYKAFRSMHLKSYQSKNEIKVYDKKGEVIAGWNADAVQEYKNKCRQTRFISQRTTGDYYKKNGDNNYYTSELYDYLFFTKKAVCNENDIVAGAMETYGKGQMEKNKYQLKQLIFNPGSRIKGIPFMGDRVSIFDDGEMEHYNFKIWADTISSQDCYVFRVTPKAGHEHKVIYNELTTWFRKEDYSILARDYALSYGTLFYDFDVKMNVRTSLIDAKLYPTYIAYDGNWHIFTKKRERVKFKNTISYEAIK